MSEPTIRYASVCSGVEAASLAWEKLDWKPVWFSEVEPFPCKVLAERFGASSPINPLDPADASDEKDRKERENWLKAIRREKMPSVTEAKVPNLGDMSKINGKEYHGTIDLLVGGTPCQGFSIAGTQKGLDDPRSALALKYVELLGSARPRWFVWENVPNAFSCNGGGRHQRVLLQLKAIRRDGAETVLYFEADDALGWCFYDSRHKVRINAREVAEEYVQLNGMPCGELEDVK